MIKALSSFLVVTLALPTHEQRVPESPCPSIFTYEPLGAEPGRWYGVVNLASETQSNPGPVKLNIVLDSKADILVYVDNKFMCGGTLVTRQHVITAAHCVTYKGTESVFNKNTLTVYLGKHNLESSINGVQIRYVSSITVHPEYNGSAISKDLSVLKLHEPISITKWVRPVCLWPEDKVDLSHVVGKNGSIVGWGYDDSGFPTKELTLVEMPVVDQLTCLRSYIEFFSKVTSDYTLCAGYRNGKSVCNGDSGGGMVFNMENSWYLRGLVSLAVAKPNEIRCNPRHYVVFTDLAQFLPWIKSHINS